MVPLRAPFGCEFLVLNVAFDTRWHHLHAALTSIIVIMYASKVDNVKVEIQRFFSSP